MRHRSICSLISVAGLSVALAACAMHPEAAPAMSAPASSSAVATLSPAATGGATGIVTFVAAGGQVDVHVVAAGLAPGSVHGFHVHDKGNCASADFMSAGGHFNPTMQPHGPQSGPHHLGDMPGLLADAAGNIDARFSLPGAALTGADGYVGHAVILHAGADDYQTQPTGNSGARLACGVIAAQ